MENRRGAATAVAKPVSTGHGFNGRSAYDGVFSGPKKVGRSVIDDYGEIFGGSGGSIPVLDVPELNESKMKVDVRSSKLDYSNVFGGCAEFDFAVSIEELIAKPKSENRTPTKTRSQSESTVDSNLLAENEVPLNEGIKKVKMLYNKTNPGSKNGDTGTVHVAKLHEVPGYSFVINEMNQDDKPVSPALRESSPATSDRMMGGRRTRRTVSDIPPASDYNQSSNGDHGFENKFNGNISPAYQNGVIFTPREVGVRKQNTPEVLRAPSRPNGDVRFDFPEFRTFTSHSSGDAAELSASPNLDEELDANSDAATSAAAVTKAIEEAQTRIKMALELMKRTKGGQKKPGFGSLKVKKRTENKGTAEEKEFGGKEAGDIDDFQISSSIKKHDAMEPTQVTPDLGFGDRTIYFNEAAGGTHENNFRSFETNHREGDIEGESPTHGEKVEIVMQSMDECRPEERNATENQDEDMNKVEATEEASKGMAKGEQDLMSGLPELPESTDKLESVEEVRDQKQDKPKQIFSRFWERIGEKIEEMLGVSTDLEATGGKLNKLEEQKPTEIKQGFETEKQEEDNSSKRSEDVNECVDNEDDQTEGLVHESGPESNDLSETEESPTVLQEIPMQEECGKIDEEASEMVKLEEEQKQSCREDENDVCSEDCAGPSDAIDKTETAEEELNDDFLYCEEDVIKLEGDGESGENEGGSEDVVDVADEIQEAEEMQEETFAQENTESIQEHADQSVEGEKTGEAKERQIGTSGCVDSQDIEQQTDQSSYDEKTEDTEEALDCHTDVSDIAEDEQQQVEMETQEPCRHKHLEDVEMLPKLVIPRENVVVEELTEECVVVEQYGRESEAVDVNNFAEYSEVFGASGLAEGIFELDEIQKQMEGARDTLAFDGNGMNVGMMNEKFEQQQQNEPEKESDMFCNVETHFEEFPCELEEGIPDFEEDDVTVEQEDKRSPESTVEVRLVDIGDSIPPDQPSCLFEGKEETVVIAREAIANEGTEKHGENHYETLSRVRRKSKAISQKKLDLEQDEQRKRDEAKERERERRKERKAVERAVREARERAFAEARERAERAAAEKTNVETRRRAKWEKPSTDAIDKALEAKLKAERAAVERATAEARQRALEKAFSETASFKARDMSEKPSSSNNGATQVSKKFDGTDVEPVQRHKARSERELRTEERAAKALAEKNMRDLLAQKEQAERNRLAETLDAEVKRWSKGKEGNLRALLSTLQYILGPESGWQPIPLTELIATVAVKKAYRKATLYVHPDKLQQRGASIQQKYTCEKVFDLLKAAWNRFSAEER